MILTVGLKRYEQNKLKKVHMNVVGFIVEYFLSISY